MFWSEQIQQADVWTTPSLFPENQKHKQGQNQNATPQ